MLVLSGCFLILCHRSILSVKKASTWLSFFFSHVKGNLSSKDML